MDFMKIVHSKSVHPCVDSFSDRVHEITRDAKVTHLHLATPRYQDIGRLHVSEI